MDKKQFLQFKSDLKNEIKVTKFYNKYAKEWQNLGFSSKEEYDKARNADLEIVHEIDSKISKKDNGRSAIYATQKETHWAYYCAKHQLNKEQREEYVKEMFGKMKEETQNQWPSYGSDRNLYQKVEKIISFYETLVCPD